MGPIRRTISLILALALFIVGLSGLCYLLLLAPWWKGWMVMAAGGMATLGGLWLWEDFINATPNEQK
jgi:CHASE2 domain-containing sensor protein